MRLNKRLIVNGRRLPLATDYVRLRLNEVGEGIFEVLEAPRGGGRRALAEYYVGVGDTEEYLVLTGAVTETREQAPGRIRLHVSELCTVLEMTHTFNLMHCTPREVIGKIEDVTGLRFLLPAGERYLDERRLQFTHYGKCRDALRRMATLWEVDGAVWFQLPDGRMYWGHWSLGPYTKAPLPIGSELILEHDRQRRTLVLPYIPALRPGMMVQSSFRFRIDSLIYSGDTARLEYTEV